MGFVLNNKTSLALGSLSTNTNAISNLSLRGAERRSNPMKNEIAAPFGLAMTPCDVKIFNAFVLDPQSNHEKTKGGVSPPFFVSPSKPLPINHFTRRTSTSPRIRTGTGLIRAYLNSRLHPALHPLLEFLHMVVAPGPITGHFSGR